MGHRGIWNFTGVPSQYTMLLTQVMNPESENNDITIMITFRSRELNFLIILSHGDTFCVSGTRFDHFQAYKMEYRGDKKSSQPKILESKTTREY